MNDQTYWGTWQGTQTLTRYEVGRLAAEMWQYMKNLGYPLDFVEKLVAARNNQYA